MPKIQRILITGGAGFVGHHFVEHFLKETGWHIVVLDKLNYSGDIDRLRDIEAYNEKRVTLLTADFTLPITGNLQKEIGDVDYILHLGAESHVDRSIEDPAPFVMSNVVGTMHMLNLARSIKGLKCFFYFGTDEVFGPAPGSIFFKEDAVHNPKNPYAASKSAGEMLVKSYMNTYNLPCIITRSMNIIGERQHFEKFVPKVINAVLDGKTITIHSDRTKKIPGVRQYIHARNVAQAYHFLIEKGKIGEEYHIVGEQEVNNLDLAKMIASILGKRLKFNMVDFHSSRPGHDLRYALDGSKIAAVGWKPPVEFEESLKRTVQWSIEHPQWLGRV